MELSCVAGLCLLLVVMMFSSLPTSAASSCERQAFRGYRMGATCTHVKLGSEFCPVLYFNSLLGSCLSVSFPFPSSFSWLLLIIFSECWLAAEASDGEEGGHSLSS